jgi:hypothetical protein
MGVGDNFGFATATGPDSEGVPLAENLRPSRKWSDVASVFGRARVCGPSALDDAPATETAS